MHRIIRTFSICKNDLYIALTAFLFFYIAYSYQFSNVLLAGDDWNALLDSEFQKDWVVTIGRWNQRFLWDLFSYNRDIDLKKNTYVSYLTN